MSKESSSRVGSFSSLAPNANPKTESRCATLLGILYLDTAIIDHSVSDGSISYIGSIPGPFAGVADDIHLLNIVIPEGTALCRPKPEIRHPKLARGTKVILPNIRQG